MKKENTTTFRGEKRFVELKHIRRFIRVMQQYASMSVEDFKIDLGFKAQRELMKDIKIFDIKMNKKK